MKLLTNKDIHQLFHHIMVIIILALFFCLLLSQMVIHDFKTEVFTYNYKVAGYLLKHGINPSYISSAFVGSKTEEEILAGKDFLDTLGYGVDMNNRLFSDGNMLLRKYKIYFISFVAMFGALIISVFFLYFKRQHNTIEKANTAMNAFMAGDATIRIDSNEEGSLYKLFASINSMTTSLNAHFEREKNTKNFLKNMITDISHQLKTPLAALKMYNEIIKDESGNEETVKKFITKTENALERMEILIQNLLKIAKLDTGAIILDKRKADVSLLVQKLAYSFETRGSQEQKSIILNGPNHVALYCDVNWIMEAIGNIVKNALDHMEEGGKVEISWEETPVLIKITIKDNGKGIHPEDIHHIFKRFYRSRFSQDIQGIGLGLSLAKSIVEAHNGTITVDSTLGKGSLFTLDFLKLTNM
ncbi:HAMP domain-containing sensor histidine kinase [Tissierella sp.]|uniref:sensor histidine kinase n=1 Tax=Tissierella sp. TaxID=41274 RepID=UPI00306C3CDB